MFDIIWTRGLYGDGVKILILIRGLLKPLNLEYRSLVIFRSGNNIIDVRTYIGDWIRFS